MAFQTVAQQGEFDLANSFHNYHLSISSSKERIAYSILDLGKKEYTFSKELEGNCLSESEQLVELNEFFKQEKLLHKEFRSVSITICNKGNALVPEALFDKKELDLYYNFNIPSISLSPKFEFLPNLKAYNVYGILPEKEELLLKFFPSAKLFHYSSVMIESSLIKYHNTSEKQVIATLMGNFMDVVVIENGKLILNNAFNYHTSEDAAYFLLFVSKELGVDMELSQFHFFGKEKSITELKSLCSSYIRNISSEVMFAEAKRFKAQENPVLFNQYRCV